MHCIGGSLALGALIGTLPSIALEIAVSVLGLVVIGLVGHALFVNGPVDQPDDLTDELEVKDASQVLAPTESAD